jgi:hypothetical protein
MEPNNCLKLGKPEKTEGLWLVYPTFAAQNF